MVKIKGKVLVIDMPQTLTKVDVGNYQTLAHQAGKVIRLGEKEIALFKLSTGEVKAVENKSPHPKGGTLADGLVSGSFVYCPLYDWKISLNDGKVQAPDEGQVKTYEVIVEDNRILLLI